MFNSSYPSAHFICGRRSAFWEWERCFTLTRAKTASAYQCREGDALGRVGHGFCDAESQDDLLSLAGVVGGLPSASCGM